MGANTRGFANLLNTDGTFLSGAINNTSVSGITDLPTAAKSDLVLISSQTASNDSSISFTSGIDSTYDSYIFKIVNFHPSTNVDGLFVNFSTDGGSNWNVTKTTADLIAQHSENNAITELRYGNYDLAQSTADLRFSISIYTGNDESMSGTLQLFNPSSTTYIKHFMSEVNCYFASSRSWHMFSSGYCNTTSAVNGVIFRPNTGNLEECTISMYGVR